jgi:hypothetical protein
LDVCVDAGVCAGAGDATGVGAVAAGDASDGPEPGHRDELGRSAVPGDVELWAPRTVLGFSHDLAFKYGQIHVVCGSASIVSLGDADGRRFSDPADRPKLSCGLWRAGQAAHGARAWSFEILRLDCNPDYWDRNQSDSILYTCGSDSQSVQVLLISIIRADALVAGHWKATMRLNIKADRCSIRRHSHNFDFTVTDYDAISIYFPGFDGIAPLVNMDLRYDPIRKMVGGYKEVDMCLYDGVGSQSEFLGVTVRDSSPRPPPGRDYAVWHGDGGSDDTQRLDYQVGLKYGGNLLAMKHGEEQLLRGIDSAQLRLVMLPGINQPVYCVPTPLVLETPPTPIASKRPGLYDGELTVELRVPTAKP